MSIRVEFIGGPADGTVHEYAYLSLPLPVLLWRSDTDTRPAGSDAAVYRRTGDAPDPVTGRWRYAASGV